MTNTNPQGTFHITLNTPNTPNTLQTITGKIHHITIDWEKNKTIIQGIGQNRYITINIEK